MLRPPSLGAPESPSVPNQGTKLQRTNQRWWGFGTINYTKSKQDVIASSRWELSDPASEGDGSGNSQPSRVKKQQPPGLTLEISWHTPGCCWKRTSQIHVLKSGCHCAIRKRAKLHLHTPTSLAFGDVASARYYDEVMRVWPPW